jgi:hypothetical protein
MEDGLQKLQVSIPQGSSGALVATADPRTARDWLLAQPSPEAVDAALSAWVRSSLGTEVTLMTEMRFPEDKPAYSVAVGARVPVRSQAEADAALEKLSGAMAPPTADQAQEWFYAMHLATAGAQRSEVDKEATMHLYVAAMQGYPADVARAAFMHFTTAPRPGTSWFPTLPEVIAQADRLVAGRRAVIGALRGWRPVSADDRKNEAIRGYLIDAKILQDEALMCKRSAPERSAELMQQAEALRAKADALRRGEEVIHAG